MKPKNLVYLFADQWRWHATGFAQQDEVSTPYMDEFAQKSMQFCHAISTYPLCSPHRAALLTGKYPTHCGIWTNCKPGLEETVMLKPQEICISDILKQAGYRTGYIGKWHLDASEACFEKNPVSGAKRWDAYTPPGERRHGFDFWYSYGAMDYHTDPHYWRDSAKAIFPKKWSVEQETDVAIEFLKQQDERPFCLFVSWNPPHPPYDLIPEERMEKWKDKELSFRENVPEEWKENPDNIANYRRYFAAVEGVDQQFGRLMQALKEQGLDKDTIVVLSADHGDCMGSHGLYGKNIWYEESIRIPLVIGGAGVQAGTSDAIVASVDHAPTLLELLGQPIPERMEGHSFADVVQGNPITQGGEEAFLCMIPGMPEMVNAYTKLGLNHKCFGWRGLRTKQHTYIVDNGTEPNAPQVRLLYDNIADPFQMNAKVLSVDSVEDIAFSARLKEWLTTLQDGFLLERE